MTYFVLSGTYNLNSINVSGYNYSPALFVDKRMLTSIFTNETIKKGAEITLMAT